MGCIAKNGETIKEKVRDMGIEEDYIGSVDEEMEAKADAGLKRMDGD